MELAIAKCTQQHDQNYFTVNKYFERTYETLYSSLKLTTSSFSGKTQLLKGHQNANETKGEIILF